MNPYRAMKKGILARITGSGRPIARGKRGGGRTSGQEVRARDMGADKKEAQPAPAAQNSETRIANPRYFRAIATLLGFAEETGCKVRFCKFKLYNGLLKDNRIGIREGMTEQETAYSLAHEIAHAYLHYDKGDTICSPNHAEYEEQADRAANMILRLLLYVG